MLSTDISLIIQTIPNHFTIWTSTKIRRKFLKSKQFEMKLTDTAGYELLPTWIVFGALATGDNRGSTASAEEAAAAAAAAADSPGCRTWRSGFTARCSRSRRKVSPSKNNTASFSLQSSLFPSNMTLGFPNWLLWNSTLTLFSFVLRNEPALLLSIEAGLKSSKYQHQKIHQLKSITRHNLTKMQIFLSIFSGTKQKRWI